MTNPTDGLGSARGSIIIDTTSVRTAVETVKAASRQIRAAMSEIDTTLGGARGRQAAAERASKEIVERLRAETQQQLQQSRERVAAINAETQAKILAFRREQEERRRAAAEENRIRREQESAAQRARNAERQAAQERIHAQLLENALEREAEQARQRAAAETARIQRESQAAARRDEQQRIRANQQQARQLEAQRRAEEKAARDAQLQNRIRTATSTGLGATLQDAGRRMLPASFIAGGLAYMGVGAANEMAQVQLTFEGIAGSQERAQRLMQALTEEARKFSLPINESLRAISLLTPTLGNSEEILTRYVGLAARLRTLRPEQGLEGAAFAINEALVAWKSGGSDFISLAERFNVPKKQLREALEETGDFAEALDIVLTRMGRTEEIARRFGQTAAGAFVRLEDNFRRILARGAEQVLPFIADLIGRLADLFQSLEENVNPQLAGFAAVFTLIAAVTPPALIAIGSLINAYKTLGVVWSSLIAKAPALSGALKAGTYAAVGVAATVTGAEIGRNIVQTIGDIPGNQVDPRLRRDSGEDFYTVIKERLGQVIVILANEFVNFAGTVSRIAQVIQNAVDLVRAGFELFVTGLRDGVLQIQIVVGELVQKLGELLGDENLRRQGQRTVTDAAVQRAGYMEYEGFGDEGTYVPGTQGQIEALQERLRQGIAITPEQEARIQQGVESLRESVVGPLIRMVENISPTAAAAQTASSDFASAFDRIRSTLDGFKAGLERFAEASMGYLEDRMGREQEYAQLTRDGTVEQIADRIQKLQDERAAIQSVLPQMEFLARFSDKARERLTELQQRLGVIGEDIGRTVDLLPLAMQRVQDELAKQTADIEARRAADLAALEAEAAKRRNEIASDAAEQRNEIEEQSEKERAQIMRRYNAIFANAIGERDALAYYLAQQSRKQELRDLEERGDEQIDQINERMQEQTETIDKRLIDQRNTINRRYDEQLQVAQNAAREAINLAQQAANAELQTKAAAYNAQQQGLQNALVTQFSTLSQFWDASVRVATGAYNSLLSMLNGASATPAPIGDGVGAGSGTTGFTPTEYQTGTNRVPRTGMYRLHAGEGVVNPETNRFLRYFLGDYSQQTLADAVAAGTGRRGGGIGSLIENMPIYATAANEDAIIAEALRQVKAGLHAAFEAARSSR